MAATPAQRVLFHGVTGSGKTSAARAYAQAVGLPFHPADDVVGWLPEWRKRPVEEQRKIAAAIAAGDRWVVDSAWSSVRELLLARAELVVALDYPRWLSLGRLLRRTVRRCITGEQVCNGNTETWRLVLSRDSIIVWHFRSFAAKRQSLAAMKADPGMPPVISFRRPRDLEAWIAEAGQATGAAETSAR
jgi:adenylate kinase family enzyme